MSAFIGFIACLGGTGPRSRPRVLRTRALVNRWQRRRQQRCARVIGDDRGSAVLEFIVIGVLILVPMAYLVMSIMRVQAATMASTQAVREAARAYATADTVSQGNAAALTAAQVAFEDQGFTLPASALQVSCPGGCLQPGSTIHVALDWQVGLPWLPASLGGGRSMSIPIGVVHDIPVDTYRLAP